LDKADLKKMKNLKIAQNPKVVPFFAEA